jgi:hypothetical protein
VFLKYLLLRPEKCLDISNRIRDIGGGLFGATVLTVLVLPAMYAAWYKVKPEEPSPVGIPTEQR